MDHPGLEEALSGGVGTGVNHMSLSPINGMTSRVSMSCYGQGGCVGISYCSLMFLKTLCSTCLSYVCSRAIRARNAVHYTWPFLLGDLVLRTYYRSCRKVLMGWEVVLMPRGDRTRLMASEVPLMYGIVAEVVTLVGCEREGGSCEGWKWRELKWLITHFNSFSVLMHSWYYIGQ